MRSGEAPASARRISGKGSGTRRQRQRRCGRKSSDRTATGVGAAAIGAAAKIGSSGTIGAGQRPTGNAAARRPHHGCQPFPAGSSPSCRDRSVEQIRTVIDARSRHPSGTTTPRASAAAAATTAGCRDGRRQTGSRGALWRRGGRGKRTKCPARRHCERANNLSYRQCSTDNWRLPRLPRNDGVFHRRLVDLLPSVRSYRNCLIMFRHILGDAVILRPAIPGR